MKFKFSLSLFYDVFMHFNERLREDMNKQYTLAPSLEFISLGLCRRLCTAVLPPFIY